MSSCCPKMTESTLLRHTMSEGGFSFVRLAGVYSIGHRHFWSCLAPPISDNMKVGVIVRDDSFKVWNVAISASQLYDYVICPHRVHLDMFEDEAKRDPVSAFVRLLWARGTAYEDQIVAALSNASFVSLRDQPLESREEATLKAIADRV